MNYDRVKMPWTQLEKGQGFFIPCLDFSTVRRYGLTLALKEGVLDARAEPCILGGATGLWFFRKSAERFRSAAPAKPSDADPFRLGTWLDDF